MLSFFPRGVLDEILNLIESVSEDFPSYFYVLFNSISVISGQWADENERLCAMKLRLRLRRFRAGLELELLD